MHNTLCNIKNVYTITNNIRRSYVRTGQTIKIGMSHGLSETKKRGINDSLSALMGMNI
jgi:hypothetical protein